VLAPSGLLFVANPDSGTVSSVDTLANRKIAETKVGSDPRMLALSPDSRLLYVSNQASATVSVLDAASLSLLSSIPVDAEPYGVVVSSDGRTIFVACSAGSVVDVIESTPITGPGRPRAHIDRRAVYRIAARIAVEARPKGLALSVDGTRLYVTHFLTGDLSVVDTLQRAVLQVISTGADSNMAQNIVLHPTNGKAYMPHIRSNTINPALLFDTTVFPVVSVIDLAAKQEIASERVDLSVGARSVNLPIDIAFSADGKHAYTVQLGSGDLSVVDINTRVRIADVDVGDGPRGIAVSADSSRAYVANSLSGDVSVVDLIGLKEIQRIPVTTSPLDPIVSRGKVLFFSSRSPQISLQRWMSCASCHFDGDMDGRTWIFAGSGPRNTPTVRGSGQTMPLHWSADRCEFQDFEVTIRQLQAGTGLIAGGTPNQPCTASNAGRAADLDALAAYSASLSVNPNPLMQDADSIQRGAAIFQRADTGCAACHPRPFYTDSTLKASPLVKHDVGTGNSSNEQNGSAFDTPSLRMLWNTAPYLHDGSAATLMDVLTTQNRGNTHGRTSQLTAAELSDLIAFLRSL
jgi:YVTN family beta-propeller protein